MKKLIILSLLVTLSSGCASMEHMSKAQERTLQMTSTALIAADWYTSQRIFAQGGHELNSGIYGKHPSKTRFNTIFAGIFTYHYFMNHTQYKNRWNMAITSTRGGVVINNVIQMR